MPRRNELPYDTTLHVRDTCVCLFLQRATRVVARHFDDALRPLDLTNQQYSLLMSLNRPEPPNMARIAAILAMDRTTLTANLKPLERRGLVKVLIDETDRRSRRLAITAAGRALLAKAFPIWRRAHAEIDRLLGDSSPDRLRADLRALSGQQSAGGFRLMTQDKPGRAA